MIGFCVFETGIGTAIGGTMGGIFGLASGSLFKVSGGEEISTSGSEKRGSGGINFSLEAKVCLFSIEAIRFKKSRLFSLNSD